MDIFHFKKFKIKQNSASVFKVNTEAVLLSAWVNIQNIKSILEIGSGTGVITIGLNQRFINLPKINTIDINENAFKLTKENIEINNSTNISPFHIDLDKYSKETNETFDLIISNPPYFDTELKSHKERDLTAKYTDSLSYHDLIKNSASLLNSNGRLAFIVPYSDLEKLNLLFTKFNFFVNKICFIKTIPTKQPLRILIDASYKSSILIKEYLTIKENGAFTEDYKALTKDYYTIF